jgi:hypothetical protein
MRELQLHQLEGKLLRADQVERVWLEVMTACEPTPRTLGNALDNP